MKWFLLMWGISSLFNACVFLWTEYKDYKGRGGTDSYGQAVNDGETKLMNLIVMLVPIYSTVIAVPLVVYILQVQYERFYKYRNKKKMLQQKKQEEQEGGTLFFGRQLIQELEQHKHPTIEQWEEKKKLVEILRVALEKMERNKTHPPMKKLDIEYEDVFKNLIQVTRNSMQIKGNLPEQIIEEVMKIAESFSECVEKIEDQLLEQQIEVLTLEKRYIDEKVKK